MLPHTPLHSLLLDPDLGCPPAMVPTSSNISEEPIAIGYDLHPDYLATHYTLVHAARDNLPAILVQHHHAHIAACKAYLHRQVPTNDGGLALGQAAVAMHALRGLPFLGGEYH